MGSYSLIFSGILTAAVISGTGAGTAEGSVFWLIVFGTGAIAISFLCSVAEAVILSITPSYIVTLQAEKKKTATILENLKANIDRPLSAILSLNTIAHTVGATTVGAQAAAIWGSNVVGLVSAVMTIAILVISEIIPKTLGALYWRPLAIWIGPLCRALIFAMYPFVILSDFITRLIAAKSPHVITREEVAAVAALSAEHGQLEQKESRILKNLFRLRFLTAYDIMTPRTVIIAYPEQMTVREVLERDESLPVSRIPIYKETIDDITGFVLSTDILSMRLEEELDRPLSELGRHAGNVSSDMPLSDLFDRFLEQREHLAIVIDEYGGTDGLVTMEDLIETLLGAEIIDEADTAADMQRVARKQWEARVKRLESIKITSESAASRKGADK